MLVDAAKYGDVEIPYFCYEPKLGQPVGACRMCLVEIEGIPKLQTACSTAVNDGMVVVTTSDRVKQAQNAIVEFLLVNHPLDCPVCDKGGECPLQDISFGWGAGRSRFIEPKRHFRKPLELSPLVAIDRERCILCYRCVRFSQEVAEDYQLVFLERADHTFVGTHDGRPYVAPFSGNIIELCPVGALTSTAYRFRARPVGHRGAPGTVCTLCPSQCNVKFTVRDDAKVLRVLARDNEEVDDGWLCDKGPLRLPVVRLAGAHHRSRSCATAARCARCRGSARSPRRRAAREGRRSTRPRLWAGRRRTRRASSSSTCCAKGSARRTSTRAPPRGSTRARALARAAGPVGAGLRHRPRRRDPRPRHRARGRGADPRPARAQGRAPQRRTARRGLEPPVHARPERRRGAALRARRRRGRPRPRSPRRSAPRAPAMPRSSELARAPARSLASAPAVRPSTATPRTRKAALRAAAEALRGAGDVVVIWGERARPRRARRRRRSRRCSRSPRARRRATSTSPA